MVDYRHFGEVISIDAFEVGGEPYKEKDASIYIFKNYEKLGVFKSRKEANEFLASLILKEPEEVRKEVLVREYLFKHL